MWSSSHRVIARSLMMAAAFATGLPVLEVSASPQPAGKAATASVQKAKAQKASAKSRKKTSDPVPEAPPAPLLPYQLPPKPPKVTFLNGQLSIAAENATLSSVMEQIRMTTGATIEAGPSFGGERVSVRLGPDAPREVIADLLNGSNYNYVLLGSLQDPQALERVIVTQRGAGVPSTSAAAPSRNFPVTVRQAAPPPEEVEIEPETEEVPEVQQVPAESTPAPGQANPQVTPQPGATPGTPSQPPQVKTPQELLQELQERMRKQQEEQNQERNEQQRQKQQEEEPE